MRIRHKKEYANVAAPWASSALPAAIPSTMPSVGMGRATLHLSRASRQLLGSSWDPAAFEIRPTAAAADPRGSTDKSQLPVRCYGGRLPRLRLQSRCLVPLAGSAPFWIIWRRPWWMPWVCGHEQSTALSTAYRRGSGKRSRRATRRVRACSWRRNPQADW